MRVLFLLILLALLAGGLRQAFAAGAGRAYCPRVTSEHNADTTELKRFRNYHGWKDKTGQELALAIWRYLSDHETGIYHFENLYDGPDPFGEYSYNVNPQKLLNVYNMGYCAAFGPLLAGIYEGVGFQRARSFGINDPSHTATEVFYDGGWHYFDMDIRGVLFKGDGTIASLEEARKDLKLWTDPPQKPDVWFPNLRRPGAMQRMGQGYARSQVAYNHRWWTGSHTMDTSLRPGESFTRFWQPQGGRWNHRPEYNKIGWLRKNILKAPVGMKSNHAHFSCWTHSNGLWHYEPNLTDRSADFAAGRAKCSGLAPGEGGLVLTADEGEAVFEVFTPYVIVPKVNDLDDFDDDCEASIVSLDAAVGVNVSLSLDNGLSWSEAGKVGPGKGRLDLTKWVKGRYGYLLKLSAGGEKHRPAIRSMAIDTWVQVAPPSIPRLKAGANRLRYDCGDRYDGTTLPMLIWPNCSDPDELARIAVEMPKRYDPKRHTSRIAGDFVVKLSDPLGRKISWFSVGATFRALTGKAAGGTGNRIAYAVGPLEGLETGEPKDFKEIHKAEVPTWTGHWRTNYDTDVRLDAPAEAVYVKFTGKPAVNVVRACLHLVPPGPHDPAVRITHGYKLDGKMTEKVVEMKAPGDYTIDCNGKVENVFIRIEKPSS